MQLSGGSGAFVRRLSQPLDNRHDITKFGNSNLYPQLISEIMFRSPTTLTSVESLSSFTSGSGFSENGDLVVNRHEQTLNDLLKNAVAPSYATNRGFALHFNVNELGGITEITGTNWEFVRFGLPSEDGIHTDVKLNVNWEQDPNKTLQRGRDETETFPLWQRREDEQLEDIENFSGFILYWTPIPDQYPKCQFDAVLDSAQLDSEIQIFELSNMQNGFQGGSFFLNRDSSKSEVDKRQLDAALAGMKGAGSSNSIYRVDVAADFEGPLLESLPANNQDRLFEITTSNVINRILGVFGTDKAILGMERDNGGIFTTDEKESAHNSYNARTEDGRTTIEDVFNRFLQFWHTGPVGIGHIIERPFDKIDDIAGVPLEDGETSEGRTETAGRSPEELQAQAGLRGSVGGVQGILAIQSAVVAGTTSYDSAVALLVEIYGFSEEVAVEILGPRTELKEEDGGDGTNN